MKNKASRRPSRRNPALAAGGVLLALCLLLAGCADPFTAEYAYSEPFSGSIGRGGGDATEIGNYNMLKSALVDIISRHEESGAFRFGSYHGSVADDLAAACLEVRTKNPMGAYAVETLTCDTSRIVSYYTADVRITYKKTAAEIQSIRGIGSLPELQELLKETLTAAGEGLVIRIYSPLVSEDYIRRRVERLFFSDPVSIVTEPRAEIRSYPEEGYNRIYELRFRYGASASRLPAMSQQLLARVGELTAPAAKADTAPMQALLCAETLAGLLTGSGGYFSGTAYSTLMEGASDSKGIALAYKAMCAALGIDCQVVKGSVGGMGAEEHYWNIIGLEGAYYHADISAFGNNPAGAFLCSDEAMWGAYLWAAEDYPACAGSLRYADLVPDEDASAAGAENEMPPLPEPAASPAPPENTAPPAATAPPETPPPEETPEADGDGEAAE